MISIYKLGGKEEVVKADLAGEFPVYLYLDDNKNEIVYSCDIHEIFEYAGRMEISYSGISFLLQDGVVPLPKTVYKKLYIIGVGDEAKLTSRNGKVSISFLHKFPFYNKERAQKRDIIETEILEFLCQAVIDRVNPSYQSFLFHSAGKDSNMIALALAEGGYQNRVISVSHQSVANKDESEVAREIATKLGFKHQTLYEPVKITQEYIGQIDSYFENIPLPSLDNITLAYPCYCCQIDFKQSNIIDGSGNDVFIGHVPGKKEFLKQRYLSTLSSYSHLLHKLCIGTIIEDLGRTRSQRVGMLGLSHIDSEKILSESTDSFFFWLNEDDKRKSLDYIDFRAAIRGVFIDQEIFIRKVRNFAFVYNANLILPWTNEVLAKYFATMPEKYLIDRKMFRNKIILREILKNRIGLDSDRVGKMAYEFDFWSILMLMRKKVYSEIVSCPLWNANEIINILKKFDSRIRKKSLSSSKDKLCIQRLYLISSWYNKNKYIKK